MKQQAKMYYSKTQKAQMRARWRKGWTLHKIAQLFDRGHSSIHRILAEPGGIRPPQRRRSDRDNACGCRNAGAAAVALARSALWPQLHVVLDQPSCMVSDPRARRCANAAESGGLQCVERGIWGRVMASGSWRRDWRSGAKQRRTRRCLRNFYGGGSIFYAIFMPRILGYILSKRRAGPSLRLSERQAWRRPAQP